MQGRQAARGTLENGHVTPSLVFARGQSSVQTLRTRYDQFVDVQRKVHGTNWMNRGE